MRCPSRARLRLSGSAQALAALLAGSAGRIDYTGPAQAPIAVAVQGMERADAVVVVDDGKPSGVVTRQDLLAYLAG